MSRIQDYEPDDTASFLRSCAFSANIRRALAGKKGKKFCQELEAALLALPEKRLAHGVMGSSDETEGAVCALGSVALKRDLDAGKPRDFSIARIDREYDPDESGWYLIEQAATELKISMPLAFAVVEENDEGGSHPETPEARYARMLEWVREQLRKSPQ